MLFEDLSDDDMSSDDDDDDVGDMGKTSSSKSRGIKRGNTEDLLSIELPLPRRAKG